MTDHALGVHSETGKLRQVVVCRPGLAHRRLTPANCQDLLFDDVFWVKQAQKDHDVFAQTMHDEGVEVLDVNDLLAQTLDLPKARDWLLDYRISPDQIGVGMMSELRAWMDELSGAQLAEYLLGGLAVDDLPFKPTGLFGSYLGAHGFILPPLPNALFTRDNSAWIFDGVSVNPMYWAARRPETLLNTAIYKFHPNLRAGRRSIGAIPPLITALPPWRAGTSCPSATALSSLVWARGPPLRAWGNWLKRCSTPVRRSVCWRSRCRNRGRPCILIQCSPCAAVMWSPPSRRSQTSWSAMISAPVKGPRLYNSATIRVRSLISWPRCLATKV